MTNIIEWKQQVKERTAKLSNKNLVAYAKPNGEIFIRMRIERTKRPRIKVATHLN